MSDKKSKIQMQSLLTKTDEKQAFLKKDRKIRRKYKFKFFTILSVVLAIGVSTLILINQNLNSQLRDISLNFTKLENEKFEQQSKLQSQKQEIEQIEKNLYQLITKSLQDQGALEETIKVKQLENQQLQKELQQFKDQNSQFLTSFENLTEQIDKLENSQLNLIKKFCKHLQKQCDSYWWKCQKEDRIYYYKKCFDDKILE